MFDKARAVRRSESAARDFVPSGFGRAPLDLRLLCQTKSIEIVDRQLDDELSGMALIDEGRRFVVVNSRHHIHRQRFTIAHEIAHHALHSDYLRANIHVDKSVLRRDPLSSEGVEIREIEANAFAAELLMPRHLMGSFADLDLADDRAIRVVAKQFGVSQAAFTYRLMNLGFL
ncbi:MAG TPA: ImmA/IrrE family metallo-endopeptidase [Sphingomicrobium sp.]|nr:ImmA/IrrE family metallo-endopeptidase [Sphingomicrobium sp.]